jgi:transcription initiation factor TFIIIB Brf1 subunit/transcription initiation factor TFIIB
MSNYFEGTRGAYINAHKRKMVEILWEAKARLELSEKNPYSLAVAALYLACLKMRAP